MRIGKKRRFHSPLDDVKGLGPKAKTALLAHIGNLAMIRAADDATLLAVPGVTARHVKALRQAFPSPVPAGLPALTATPDMSPDVHPKLEAPAAVPTRDGDRQRR
jgi:hypothetical protein